MMPRALLIVAFLFAAGAAHADEPLGDRRRSDVDVARRLAFIESRLEAGTPAANRWSYGWLSTYGALTVAQIGVALGTTDRARRIDMAVGAFSSSLGVIPFALFPFTPRFAASQLAEWPGTTPSERRRKLVQAERLLRKSAESEAFGQSWMTHLGGLAVNFAFGLVLAAGYHRLGSGVTSTTVGIAVGELQIVTQPTAAIDDWEAYSRGDFDEHPSRDRRVHFAIVPAPGGLGLGARF